MDLNEILIFVKVAQLGSFNRAAERLGMPNSTVSTKISSLEKRLGVTLLHRTTRKLNLTETGETFYREALKHVEGLEAAESTASLSQGEPKGILRVTAPVLFSTGILPIVLCAYSKKYPQVSIEVIASDVTLDLIGENIDIAIRSGKLPDSSLKAIKLGTGYFAAYASPSYLKSHAKITHPKDLLGHTCLQFSYHNSEHWEFTNPNTKSKVKVVMSKKFLSNELYLIKELAIQGHGIALLPILTCLQDGKEKKLVRILDDWQSESRELHLVYPAGKFVSPKLSAFIEISRDLIKEQIRKFGP